MVVQYKAGTRYLCNYLRQQYRVPVCQYIPADPVYAKVVEAFFAALSPVELDVYHRALAAQQQTEEATTRAHLAGLCSRSATDTWFASSVRVPSSGSWPLRSLATTPGLLGHPVRPFQVSHQETRGSPKFPGSPFECLPRSSTPVVSWALALTHLGLLPSAPLPASALATCLAVRSYPWVHNYTHFGAHSRGLHPCSPWLRTPVAGFTRRVRYCPVG
jgi:hypothetical protein